MSENERKLYEGLISTYSSDERVRDAAHDLLRSLKAILAFYEPGQRHLDTNAWTHAEASARRAVAKAEGR